MTARVPSAPPNANAPTSPMNTCAGYALYQRNASPAPASAPQNMSNSPAPGMYGMNRYLEYNALPVRYAISPSADPTITVGMIANPSRPSVRFTALQVPT